MRQQLKCQKGGTKQRKWVSKKTQHSHPLPFHSHPHQLSLQPPTHLLSASHPSLCVLTDSVIAVNVAISLVKMSPPRLPWRECRHTSSPSKEHPRTSCCSGPATRKTRTSRRKTRKSRPCQCTPPSHRPHPPPRTSLANRRGVSRHHAVYVGARHDVCGQEPACARPKHAEPALPRRYEPFAAATARPTAAVK